MGIVVYLKVTDHQTDIVWVGGYLSSVKNLKFFLLNAKHASTHCGLIGTRLLQIGKSLLSI